jgi:uncharacterized membrane protein YuzA (DUF378 family)
MRFARLTYLIAGVCGLAILLPQYFLEARIGRDFPPSITHPEYYYGFIGVAAAWQFAFIIISRDPMRYRPVMVPAIVEKLSFGVAMITLFTGDRLSAQILAAGLLDLMFGALFIIAYLKLRKARLA